MITINKFIDVTSSLRDGSISREDWQNEVLGRQRFTQDNLRKVASFCEELISNIDGCEDVDFRPAIERRKNSNSARIVNKKLYKLADREMIVESIEDSIRALEPIEVNAPKITKIGSKSRLVCLADQHYGTEFRVPNNTYDKNVFCTRMEDLLANLVDDLGKDTSIDEMHIALLGDSVQGILRMSDLRKMETSVMDAVIEFSEFMSQWIAKLRESCDCRIVVHVLGGNHDSLRLLERKPNFSDESLAKIIHKFIDIRMETVPDVIVTEYCPYSEKYIDLNGHEIIICHGDMKIDFSQMSCFYGNTIEHIICGHLHRFSVESMGMNANRMEKMIIHTPSIVGTDCYAKTIGKYGCAGATVIDYGAEVVFKNIWL